ncbi:hypothetical protein RFI_03406 [Reticulomyxa filosa]|uniref:Uncharacterized protein n=1 Tax=Reticulomyxa filosa TaxID=46433 RepID=X6P681_RETFI|nr:hypothetical protein RFI_03406 [Reticulomyxa filosa]|eukprot:ETO33701.1 hypothetical protein RFI_03406 [Reticulomyxa filosa]
MSKKSSMSSSKVSAWDYLFGRDGVLCRVHDSCRIDWENEPGWLIFDEGTVWGGYCEVTFYPDNDQHSKIKVFGGSVFNRQFEACQKKFQELREKYEIFAEIEGESKDEINNDIMPTDLEPGQTLMGGVINIEPKSTK